MSSPSIIDELRNFLSGHHISTREPDIPVTSNDTLIGELRNPEARRMLSHMLEIREIEETVIGNGYFRDQHQLRLTRICKPHEHFAAYENILVSVIKEEYPNLAHVPLEWKKNLDIREKWQIVIYGECVPKYKKAS